MWRGTGCHRAASTELHPIHSSPRDAGAQGQQSHYRLPTASPMMSTVRIGWSTLSMSLVQWHFPTKVNRLHSFPQNIHVHNLQLHCVLLLHRPWCPHNTGNGVRSPCHPWWAAAGSAFQCGAYRMSMFRTVIVRAWLLASIVVMDDTSSIG